MKFPDWLPVYGDKNYRGPCLVESAEQITFFNWLRLVHPELGQLALHPRNEGKRTRWQAGREKAEGLAVGASDVIIPGAPSLVMEIKRADHTKSRWQRNQLSYLRAAKNSGAMVCVALGWEGAKEAVEDYLKVLQQR